jgi:hypothetical protein
VGRCRPNFPDFWNWAPCASIGTAGPGEWGDVDSITFTVTDCQSVATKPATWGQVKVDVSQLVLTMGHVVRS